MAEKKNIVNIAGLSVEDDPTRYNPLALNVLSFHPVVVRQCCYIYVLSISAAVCG